MSVRATGTARSWWHWYAGAAGCAVLAGSLAPSAAVANRIDLLAAAAVAGAIAAGLRLHRPPRPLPWVVLLAAVTVSVSWSVLAPVLRDSGVLGTSADDLLYYVSYPLLGLGVFLLPARAPDQPRLAGMTEAGIIACGAAVLWWTLLVDPMLIDADRLPDQVHLVVFPLCDLGLLALGIRLLLIGGTVSASLAMIAAATSALLIADATYFVASLDGGDPPRLSVICWLVTNALLGTAALHPSMARSGMVSHDRDLPDRIAASSLYVAIVVATPITSGVYLLYEDWANTFSTADIIVPMTATALTSALVVQRMRELNRLSRRRATALEQSLDKEAELQQELRHRAQYDTLTGLPNRSLLDDRITAALAAEAPGALLLLDLDDFKDVNDRFGHGTGDELLTAVAARLREMLGDRGLLARLGSDEFAVLLDDMPPDAAGLRAEEVLVAMRRPVRVRALELFATVSIGLRALDPGLLTADILRDAYLALHQAKAAGRDQLATFDRRLREQRLATARTLERLRGAIERDELLLHYQPLVRLADERMVGVEALVRWQPMGRRLVPPDEFVPAAEDSGMIVGIGAWVLRQACHTVADWRRRDGSVSVNVSPRQLREPDFAALVLDCLRSSGLPPQALILEITEGVLVASGQVTEQAIRHLSMLRERGVRVAVDDFGTGYSSLAYLRDLPIDSIKIDKSFMPEPGAADPAARAMVKAIIDLAAGLGLATVAEGVETAAQVALLRELGCERGQGYYFAKPVPAAEAAALLTASHHPAAHV
jgi:diguanylate cyclase (GGDEF)-like protein